MRNLPTALKSHVESGVTTVCWCWKISRADGVIFGFTNHDRDLAFEGITYEAATGMLASEAQSSLGLSVDNMDVEGAIESDRISDTDLAAGKFDDAEIDVYLVNWQDVNQRTILKRGNLGEVSRGKTHFTTEIRGLTARLQQEQGRVYQYTCDVDVGSPKCGIDLTSATYKGTGTVITSNGRSFITVSGLDAYDHNWFSKGRVAFTSGFNDGVSVEVRSFSTVQGAVSISLWAPSPFDIQVGDTFTITVGCDKRFATCRDKFSNQVNFRGFPHMPSNDLLITYASKDDTDLDGGSLFNG